MYYIEVKNVSQIYSVGNEPVNALTNISFAIEKGEFIAVTGPSGCGKSTLLHMIGGLSKPSSGQILNCGVSLYEKRNSEISLFRRREVGIVYQFYNLVPELTARENLLLPALMDGKSVDQREVKKILTILGMENKANFYPGQLSGGQQQKIAIGRALINHPKLLLADEPTGNLDSAKRDELLQLLRYMNEQEEMTILVVTHDSVVAQKANRVLHMMDGKIVNDEVISYEVGIFMVNFALDNETTFAYHNFILRYFFL